jgi:hypothetical protein
VRVRFSFDGAGTEVRVVEKALAFEVASVFPDGRVEEAADAGADGLSQAAGGAHAPVMRVTSGEDGYHFVTQGGLSTYSSVPDLLAAVEFAVITDLLAQDDQTTHLHAAGAVTPNGAVLVPGPSGAGKSSMAFAWSLAGYPLLGDDVVRLDEAGLLRSFPRLLKVDPSLVTHHGLLLEDTPAWDPESDEAWFDPAGAGGWASGGCRVAVIARIQYGVHDGMQVREKESGFGLRVLLDAVQATGLRSERSLDRMIALVEGARVFDVRFGSSDRAAHELAEMVAGRGAEPAADLGDPVSEIES